MEEFLRQLGITQDGEMQGKSYVVNLEDSNTFGKIYSKLDKSDLVDEDNESSKLTENGSTVKFYGDDYVVLLEANFDDDTYSLTIKEEDE